MLWATQTNLVFLVGGGGGDGWCNVIGVDEEFKVEAAPKVVEAETPVVESKIGDGSIFGESGCGGAYYITLKI